MVIYMCQCCSLSLSHPVLPLLCLQVSSLHLCLCCCPADGFHQYHFSRFHICVLIYSICFSLSDLLHSVQQALVSATLLELTQMCFFLWLSNSIVYMYHIFIHSSVIRHLHCSHVLTVINSPAVNTGGTCVLLNYSFLRVFPHLCQ